VDIKKRAQRALGRSPEEKVKFPLVVQEKKLFVDFLI